MRIPCAYMISNFIETQTVLISTTFGRSLGNEGQTTKIQTDFQSNLLT